MTDSLLAESVIVLGAEPDEVERLTHSVVASATTGVFRVRAGARSAIVKVIAPRGSDPADASRSAASFRYWRREPELLTGPVLDVYREAGLRPPAVLAAIARGPEMVALWQEEVTGVRGDSWDVATFTELARRLGRAQGVLAAATPGHAPLSRGFLRDYLAEKSGSVSYGLLGQQHAWNQPRVRAAFPAALAHALAGLHRDQSRLLAWMEAAPRTVAHLDVWPLNVFAGADGFGLVDWAFAGDGALGEDPGNLVFDAVLDLLHPTAILPDLDIAVFGGYLDGLNDAGWDGDERQVRLAMCASAVKYDWLAPAMLARAADVDLVGYGGLRIEDAELLFRERGRALAFIVARTDEARRIAAELEIA